MRHFSNMASDSIIALLTAHELAFNKHMIQRSMSNRSTWSHIWDLCFLIMGLCHLLMYFTAICSAKSSNKDAIGCVINHIFIVISSIIKSYNRYGPWYWLLQHINAKIGVSSGIRPYHIDYRNTTRFRQCAWICVFGIAILPDIDKGVLPARGLQ